MAFGATPCRVVIPASAGMTALTLESSFPRRRESIQRLPNTTVFSRARGRISLLDGEARFPDRDTLSRQSKYSSRTISATQAGLSPESSSTVNRSTTCTAPLRSAAPTSSNLPRNRAPDRTGLGNLTRFTP